MRFLKSMRSPEAAETAAFIERLNAITGRGRVELASHSMVDEPPIFHETPPIFSMPGDLAAENG